MNFMIDILATVLYTANRFVQECVAMQEHLYLQYLKDVAPFCLRVCAHYMCITGLKTVCIVQ